MRTDSNADRDEHAWMEHALREAALAPEHDDVPVGAVVVHLATGEIVARAHNARERDRDPTAHAELIALQAAARRAGSWRLTDHALVVTLEPCPMCAGAAWASRIGRLVFGAADPKAGAAGSLYNFAADPTAHAELLAMRDAAAALGTWRLDGCTVVVTLEPCPMCAGALVAGRVARVVFGAPDPKAGACGTLYNLCVDPRLNHEVAVVHGVMADESAALLTSFFAGRR